MQVLASQKYLIRLYINYVVPLCISFLSVEWV